MPKAVTSLMDRVFGRLTVIARAESTVYIRGNGRPQPVVRWMCRCECGNTLPVPAAALKSGHTKSCGCWHSDSVRERFTKHVRAKLPIGVALGFEPASDPPGQTFAAEEVVHG